MQLLFNLDATLIPAWRNDSRVSWTFSCNLSSTPVQNRQKRNYISPSKMIDTENYYHITDTKEKSILLKTFFLNSDVFYSKDLLPTTLCNFSNINQKDSEWYYWYSVYNLNRHNRIDAGSFKRYRLEQATPS